jgi:hypothetical protein
MENMKVTLLFMKFIKFSNVRVFNSRFHKDPSLIPIPNKIKPVHTLPPYLFKIHFSIILTSKTRP